MAHRALVAYERSDGRYDVHTSRLGALDCRLARTISPADPYAGGDVDPEPNVVARPFEHALTMVDPARHEAIYRVEADYQVRTYLPLWFGLDHYLGPEASSPSGLVVAVDGPDDAARLRRWLQTAKGVLADGISEGVLDVADADRILENAVRTRVDGEIYDPGRTDGY